MTNKANSKFSFLRRNLKGCPEKLKQTVYFSLIRSFMEYGATVWDPYQKYNSDKVEKVQRRAASFVKSRYSRYSSVSDMLDVLGGHLLLKGDRRLDLFCFTSKESLSRRTMIQEENTTLNLDRLVIQQSSMDSHFS